ncbi:ABC transporter permease [Microbacterium sp. PMB16]|uniref:ABC transporter permease n=1 Tax=Microbacterium sp. PMB16 TaxID=3120157 RepID=UPI003F4B30A8
MTTSTTSILSARVTARKKRRPVRGYILRWVVGPILTVFVAAFIIFSALSLAPGDPVSQILGGRATEEQRIALRERLGLDLPMLGQFFNWMLKALQGDLGVSFVYKQDVTAIVAPRLGVTLTLVAMSMLLIIVIGVSMGVFGGVVRKAGAWVSAVVGLMISVPSFVAASFLISTFAVAFGWFPTFGSGVPGPDRIWHLTLPAIALSIGWIAFLAQITMASVAEERDKEHVMTAIGRGLPFRLILRKHILRNAGIPVIAASGLALAALMAGAIVVESAFAVDGIGSLLVSSVLAKDQPVVAAISLLIVSVFVVMTTVVDVLHVALDPRLREEVGG